MGWIFKWLYNNIILIIQQVRAFTALTVRKRFAVRQKSHRRRRVCMDSACDCEGTEQLRIIEQGRSCHYEYSIRSSKCGKILWK